MLPRSRRRRRFADHHDRAGLVVLERREGVDGCADDGSPPMPTAAEVTELVHHLQVSVPDFETRPMRPALAIVPG
jgi:hypothetical protein